MRLSAKEKTYHNLVNHVCDYLARAELPHLRDNSLVQKYIRKKLGELEELVQNVKHS